MRCSQESPKSYVYTKWAPGLSRAASVAVCSSRNPGSPLGRPYWTDVPPHAAGRVGEGGTTAADRGRAPAAGEEERQAAGPPRGLGALLQRLYATTVPMPLGDLHEVVWQAVSPQTATFDVLPGESNGEGYEIRTREGLPPTRFPTVVVGVTAAVTGVHPGSRLVGGPCRAWH